MTDHPTADLLASLITLAGRAPSPHNTQPWSPHIVGGGGDAVAGATGSAADGGAAGDGASGGASGGGGAASGADAGGAAIEVCVVPSRTLPAGDPSFRDVVLALGAWVESFAIGAAEAGFDTRVETLAQLERLEELPLTGPADGARPVLRVSLVPTGTPAGTPPPPTGTPPATGSVRSTSLPPVAPPGTALPTPAASTGTPPGTAPAHRAHPFTSADVRDRAVFRGRLVGHPATWDTLSDVDLPPWLTLRRLDDKAMAYLSRLGIAFTASRPSVAKELLQWLRLDPAHPRYTRDGMTDAMLGIPAPLARLAAPATRWRRIQNPLVGAAGVVGRAAESLERARTLRPLALSLSESDPESATHLVLVANARLAALDDGPRTTAAMDSRIGVSEPDALEAGRVLQRLWLHAHTLGLVVSPHSELIDSPLAHGLLRKRLSLGRSDVALSVFSAGVASGEVPRSPRLTDDRGYVGGGGAGTHGGTSGGGPRGGSGGRGGRGGDSGRSTAGTPAREHSR
ncbi:hypothetical protein B7R54_15230 [Subtercola boreus]|uniref:Nitroreductase domain-containing protein n=1 Tax=Subtercola boreus TaxID=120213 RepID=A0A3E0VL92_9MICO|nr:hypothetical protein [Subtercola boreus]RFA10405.1 hypothetical protein B7R54_15230 [Subtercola boreus]TQL56073.1 nitroreductase [Subtercola boreus]